MQVIQNAGTVEVKDFGEIDLTLTLNCGQAFRWNEIAPGLYRGVVRGCPACVSHSGGSLYFTGVSLENVLQIFVPYFDLEHDYAPVLCCLCSDDHIRSAYTRCGTLRILRQESWEAFCTFIVTQCNNIPRIKGIIDKLCCGFGRDLGEGLWSFPDAQTIAALSEDDLAVLHAGYRVPYILDAARRVAGGETDLDAISRMSEADARAELMKVNGVGKKVADCTLLFGLGFRDVFPVDRHIRRAVDELYPDGLPECFAGHRGLAQQYLFLSRISPDSKKE